jgi:hypothetical protein
MQITLSEAVQKIEEAKESGRVFGVTFVKRTDGSVRDMNCRGGVKKGVTGQGMKYDPESKNLVTVFDMQNGEFRHINQDTITRVTMNGVTFTVVKD